MQNFGCHGNQKEKALKKNCNKNLFGRFEKCLAQNDDHWQPLTLNGPIATKVVCFSLLLKSLRLASMANSVDPDQTAPIGAVCSGSMLFASILNSSVMIGNYLQQTT